MILRLVTFALILLPSVAWAGVCELERPDWVVENGPATGLEELFFLFTSLPGLGILGALTLAALTAQKRYFAISTAFAVLVGAGYWLNDTYPDETTLAAIAEGCVGPQTLPIAACAMIAVTSVIFLGLLWLRDRPADRI
ncbi:hypothetical protein RXV86_11055 [Alisedimentitalea sp. MJ-SS2]|uniref:hypothetical protein n=1 Tax=Aliisedimentitalea sp. MJ-SS2 TaxID=3049795 RepID=UPI0029089111|nr:hypothetical protein [Alisedimentitalea sp. MJ-SS2]MDU8927922.1 hypothetical protein [Alisedimentitalea sp. MJ-SS2]